MSDAADMLEEIEESDREFMRMEHAYHQHHTFAELPNQCIYCQQEAWAPFNTGDTET